jgi:hypothetical protein
MFPLPVLYALLAAGVQHWLAITRPWGGFSTFGLVARRAALMRATSIGVFVPGDDDA